MEPAGHFSESRHAVWGVDAGSFYLISDFEIGHHDGASLLGVDEGVLWEAGLIFFIVAYFRAELISVVKLPFNNGQGEEKYEDKC